ncbi:hypothetical protein CAEBREN_01647 [Caenorhabditis brenneri]|uniref:Uncharacterized protein n=1 Tax=Caenorhabditis brenneri TaxID=135651 RepID=G0M8T1_CAEBE|nr:hypothetical protein CAEBREN_01647 [Caenorhabditis brenneri]
MKTIEMAKKFTKALVIQTSFVSIIVLIPTATFTWVIFSWYHNQVLNNLILIILAQYGTGHTIIFSTLTDVHLTFLMQPIPLYLLPASFTVGLLSEYFDVSSHVCTMMTAFIALCQLECLVLRFLKKHQSIAVILKMHVIPKHLLYFNYFLTVLLPITTTVYFELIRVTKEKQLDFIQNV